MKPSFIANLNKCGINFSSMIIMNVPVYKMWCGSMICVLRVLNLICLNWLQMQQFCCILCWLCRHSHLFCQSRQWFSCRCLQSSMNFMQFSISYHLCSAFSLGHFSACLQPAWIRTQVICMCVLCMAAAGLEHSGATAGVHSVPAGE